jgi:hypothetical protein
MNVCPAESGSPPYCARFSNESNDSWLAPNQLQNDPKWPQCIPVKKDERSQSENGTMPSERCVTRYSDRPNVACFGFIDLSSQAISCNPLRSDTHRGVFGLGGPVSSSVGYNSSQLPIPPNGIGFIDPTC